MNQRRFKGRGPKKPQNYRYMYEWYPYCPYYPYWDEYDDYEYYDDYGYDDYYYDEDYLETLARKAFKAGVKQGLRRANEMWDKNKPTPPMPPEPTPPTKE